jgi:hypothetical protein
VITTDAMALDGAMDVLQAPNKGGLMIVKDEYELRCPGSSGIDY